MMNKRRDQHSRVLAPLLAAAMLAICGAGTTPAAEEQLRD